MNLNSREKRIPRNQVLARIRIIGTALTTRSLPCIAELLFSSDAPAQFHHASALR
jgi:hypothetical protein